MNSERKTYSPVICWTSEWNTDNTLRIIRMNKASSNYQKALDKLAAIKTWEKK